MERDTSRFEATIVAEELRDPEAVYRSLLPEAGRGKRFEARIERSGERVVIEITAKDPTALRAALNSYLRLLILLDDLEGSLP